MVNPEACTGCTRPIGPLPEGTGYIAIPAGVEIASTQGATQKHFTLSDAPTLFCSPECLTGYILVCMDKHQMAPWDWIRHDNLAALPKEFRKPRLIPSPIFDRTTGTQVGGGPGRHGRHPVQDWKNIIKEIHEHASRRTDTPR